MIWTNDVVEFKGKYYTIPASKIVNVLEI